MTYRLPEHLFEKYNYRVAVHYAVYDNKRIIHYGTSRACGHGNSKSSIHAEELAFRYIYTLKKKKKKNINKLNILIWRFDSEIKPKTTYCCLACTKLVKKHNFQNNIFTISGDESNFCKAIIRDPKPSRGHIMRARGWII